jgi:hypothetical protein
LEYSGLTDEKDPPNRYRCAVRASTAAHADALPTEMLGSWCFILGSNADNPFQLFFSRKPAGRDCSGNVNTLTLYKDHSEESVGTCLFDKVQQTAPNA